MREINRRIVGAVLVSKDKKVFLAKGNPKVGGVYADCWLVPGGGIDEGETAEQAVIREVLEETGIDISICKLEVVGNSRKGESEKTLKTTGERVLVHMDFVEYRVDIADKNAADIEVVLSDEHSEYKWFDKSEMVGLKLSPPSEELFKEMGYIE